MASSMQKREVCVVFHDISKSSKKNGRQKNVTLKKQRIFKSQFIVQLQRDFLERYPTGRTFCMQRRRLAQARLRMISHSICRI
jgi:hypothetical protein